jgi:gliding-associated putative ABC transporter substrate-binding component GldG
MAPENQSPSQSMDARKRTYASSATVYTVFTVGAIVLLNLISTRVFGRLDLTENGIYTLSPQSKALVKGLSDPLTIKAYISSDLQPELKSVSTYVRDLMDEYRSSSNGKIRFEAFDPSTDKKYEDDANACKVAKLQVQAMREQKLEVNQVYMGLCFQYGGQSEAIPQVTQLEGLEYMTDSLIKRMTQKKRKIAFTTGHNESDTSQGFQNLKHFLDQEYEISSVNPSVTPIGDDVDAIVVGGPKQAFDDKGRKELDAFLMKGKGAIFLVDGMSMSSPQGNMPELQGAQPKIGQPNNTGLGELLEKYGFKVGENFLFDKKQSAPGILDFGGRKMLAQTPAFLVAEASEVKDKDFSVLQGITALVFPFGSTVDLVGPLASGHPTEKDGRLWTLAKSSPESWKHTGFLFFSPNSKIEEAKDPKDHGSFALGYAYQGTLKTAFPSAAPPAAPGMSGAEQQPGQAPQQSKKAVRLVVVGDSDFANDEVLQAARFVPAYQAGIGMLFNAISWVIEDETLTAVRTKSVASRPLKPDADSKAGIVKIVNLVLVPLGFIAFGIVRWRVRRATRLQQKL